MYYSASSIKCKSDVLYIVQQKRSYYTYVTNCNDGYYLDTNISHDLRFRNGVCLAVNPGTSDFYEVDAASSIDCEAESRQHVGTWFSKRYMLGDEPRDFRFYEEVAASRIDCQLLPLHSRVESPRRYLVAPIHMFFSHNISIVLGAAYNDLYREYFDNVDRG